MLYCSRNCLTYSELPTGKLSIKMKKFVVQYKMIHQSTNSCETWMQHNEINLLNHLLLECGWKPIINAEPSLQHCMITLAMAPMDFKLCVLHTCGYKSKIQTKGSWDFSISRCILYYANAIIYQKLAAWTAKKNLLEVYKEWNEEVWDWWNIPLEWMIRRRSWQFSHCSMPCCPRLDGNRTVWFVVVQSIWLWE